jgi:hypothetical protein
MKGYEENRRVGFWTSHSPAFLAGPALSASHCLLGTNQQKLNGII